jgi:tRNA/rRNA methyltransferase
LETDILQEFYVVLVRPRFPENIGAAARAVANMGLGGLKLVSPERMWPVPMQRLATDQGKPVLENMEVYTDLKEALAQCKGAMATTARLGYKRGRLLSPRTAAPQAVTEAKNGKFALVFGPEDRGLTTEEVDICSMTVRIPTSESSSLNLAQSVIVLAYEIRMATLKEENHHSALAATSFPKPANLEEKEALKEHLKQALLAIGVLRKSNPSHFFRPFKNVLDRAGLSSREVRALRGIARQILWLHGQLKKK